jgi:hypothetical protein
MKIQKVMDAIFKIQELRTRNLEDITKNYNNQHLSAEDIGRKYGADKAYQKVISLLIEGVTNEDNKE